MSKHSQSILVVKSIQIFLKSVQQERWMFCKYSVIHIYRHFSTSTFFQIPERKYFSFISYFSIISIYRHFHISTCNFLPSRCWYKWIALYIIKLFFSTFRNKKWVVDPLIHRSTYKQIRWLKLIVNLKAIFKWQR